MPSASARPSMPTDDDDVVGIRKIRSRHTWKLETASHHKGQPLSRKSVRFVHSEVAKRKEKFHFSKQEIESLCTLFYFLVQDGDKNSLDRTGFQDVLHNIFEITDDLILDRIFKVFDQDNDGLVSMLEWVTGLSTYLRGTLDEKIAFAFDCYSLKGERFITRQEMFQLLKSCVPSQMNDENPIESVKELVEITLKKMDKDRDNRLSDVDFATSVREDPLLLSCFGQLFPSSTRRAEFEQIALSSLLTKHQLEAIVGY